MSDRSGGRTGLARLARGISPATVIATLALVVALGGVARSAIPGPDGKIYACYVDDPDPDLSYVYLRDHDQGCQGGEGESAISWDQSGTGADPAQLAAASALLAEAESAQAVIDDLLKTFGDKEEKFAKLIPKTLAAKDLKRFSKKQGAALDEINKTENQLKGLLQEDQGQTTLLSKILAIHRQMTAAVISSLE